LTGGIGHRARTQPTHQQRLGAYRAAAFYICLHEKTDRLAPQGGNQTTSPFCFRPLDAIIHLLRGASYFGTDFSAVFGQRALATVGHLSVPETIGQKGIIPSKELPNSVARFMRVGYKIANN